MTIESSYRRPLGTMIAYGFERLELASEFALARRLGATVLEILPDWKRQPDPVTLRTRASDAGFLIHSAHGSWGNQSVRADRVDLGNLDVARRLSSVDDLKWCLDWLQEAGGTFLIVHPGGLSSPQAESARREALAQSLRSLVDHAEETPVVICVENMPPGVYPGSQMETLAGLVAEINHPQLGLALDTGHAHLSSNLGVETLAASLSLRSTHVHDNNGIQDIHEPPGLGTIDWAEWVQSLNAIEYRGPIMLECVRRLRSEPTLITPSFLEQLDQLTRGTPPSGPFGERL